MHACKAINYSLNIVFFCVPHYSNPSSHSHLFLGIFCHTTKNNEEINTFLVLIIFPKFEPRLPGMTE